MGAWEDGFAAGFRAGRREESSMADDAYRAYVGKPTRKGRPKMQRKASAYSKRYGAAFKRIAPKNKKKGGGWKQGGFMRTQKAAHKAARK
jgi:hypothetical protein